MARALQLFLNSDLRCGHEGLAAIAKRQEIDVEKLERGEFVIFINALKNRVKLFTANNVIAYLQLKTGSIDLRTIALIPQSFNASGKIDYDSALKEVIEKHLSGRRSSQT